MYIHYREFECLKILHVFFYLKQCVPKENKMYKNIFHFNGTKIFKLNTVKLIPLPIHYNGKKKKKKADSTKCWRGCRATGTLIHC